VDIIKNTL
jgi:hypothetical protein